MTYNISGHLASGAIDIFIPTCLSDIEQASMLLQSLNRWLDDGVVASINIAAIDAPDAFPRICTLQTGKFQSRTRYLRLGDLGLGEPDGHGWLMQQAAKLAFARHTTTEHYMVLDSKNIALRRVQLKDLVQDGRAAWVLEDVQVHHNWWRGSSWALSHRSFDMKPGRQALSAATPVIFHSASVIEMLNWMERRHKYSIGDFYKNRFMHLDRSMIRRLLFRAGIAQPKEFTEFMMYYVFMDREGRCDSAHFVSPLLHEVPCYIWQDQSPSERSERLERILAGRTSGFFVGIQKGAWMEVADADKARVRNFAGTDQ